MDFNPSLNADGTIMGQMPSTYQQTPTSVSPSSAFAANQQQYQDIIGGYHKQLQDWDKNAAAASAGYHQITNQAMGYLKGSQAGTLQGLQNQYQQNLAGTNQQMMSQGLGNTTAMEGAQRAVQGQYNQGVIGANSQYAGQLAGTLGQLGSQATGFDVASAQQKTALQSGQLGMMGGYLQGGQQIFGQLAGQQAGYGYNRLLNQQQGDIGLSNQSQLNQQNYQYQSALAQQAHQYQKDTAQQDFTNQNQYDTSGGGYAGG